MVAGLLALGGGGADPVPGGGGPVRRAGGSTCSALGAVPRVLVWDGEGAVGRWRGGRSELTADCQAFRGTLATKVMICKPADPEAKGLVERLHDYLERSFLPGRTFTGPADFNAQLQQLAGDWRTPGRSGRSGCAPADRIAADRAAMLALPPVAPIDRLAVLEPAGPGPLRPPGRQRLLGPPGGDRPPDRGRRRPAPGPGALRRTGSSPTTSGSGPSTRPSPPPSTSPRPRRCAPSGSGCCARHRPATRSRSRALSDYDTRARADRHRRRRRMSGMSTQPRPAATQPGHRRGGRVPDPGAEGPDAARGRRPARRTGPRRVLDARGVPHRLPATRGLGPGEPRRRRPDPRRPLPVPQEPGGVRLRPRPRPQARPHRPPRDAGLRHRQGERAAPRAARHRQDPPRDRAGDPGLPSRPPGAVRDRQPSGSPGSPTPTTPAGCRTSCAGWAATRCSSSTRSATSRSSPKPRTCSSSSCQQPLRTGLADRHQQQALRPLGRGLRRRRRRRRHDRPARPPRRSHRPQRRQLPAQGPRPRPRPTSVNRRHITN